jgi:hypothetical protein
MTYNFTNHRLGDRWKGIESITILDCNSAINLNDCDIFIQFRPKYNPASPVFLELSTYNSKILILNKQNGIIKIPEQVIDIPCGEYKYDLQVNFPTGVSKTYLTGLFKVLPQITRL